MSEQDAPQNPPNEPAEDAPEAPEQPEGGEENEPFDPERARSAINKKNSENANLRRRLKELEPLAAKAKELEDAKKTETEKLTERASAAEHRAQEATLNALRMEVALDKAPDGMPLPQLRKLAKRLSGATREELEADAEELFADLAPAGGGKPPSKRPTESLKGGADPDKEPDPNPADLADAVHKARRGF